jgi:acyl-CoA thioester hydrolase
MPHTFSVRVYYEDTDAAGVVYYANYLKFAERARTEALRETGVHQSALLKDEGMGFVVREIHAEYLKPARLDDLLTITSKIHDIGRASLTLAQDIFREKEHLFSLTVRLAVVNGAFAPVRLSDTLKTAIEHAFKP